jgi:hypothetical protein
MAQEVGQKISNVAKEFGDMMGNIGSSIGATFSNKKSTNNNPKQSQQERYRSPPKQATYYNYNNDISAGENIQREMLHKAGLSYPGSSPSVGQNVNQNQVPK